LPAVLRAPAALVRGLLGGGYLILAADEGAIARCDPQRFRRAWVSLLVLSVLWGVAAVWIWQGGLDLFYHVRFRLRVEVAPWLAAAALVAAMSLGLYRRALLGLGDMIARGEPAARALVAYVVVIVWTLALLSIERPGAEDYADRYLPWNWAWLYPTPAWLRTILLAPVWGAWSMLIAAQFCRVTERTEGAVAAMARGCGPVRAAFSLAAPAVPTLVYFHYLAGGQMWLAAVPVVVAVAGGAVLCRLCGGMRLATLRGINVLTQLAFTLTYIACR
jgi:hypothetical protein